MTHIDFKYIEKVFSSLYGLLHIKIIITSIATLLCWIFDNDFSTIYIVYLLMLIDCFFGVWNGAKRGELTSRGFYQTCVKFTVYSLMVITGKLVDKNIGFPMSSKAIEIFLTCTEGISILENVSKLGFPVPQKLIKTLKIYYDKK